MMGKKKSADDTLRYLFLISRENKLCHSIQIVSIYTAINPLSRSPGSIFLPRPLQYSSYVFTGNMTELEIKDMVITKTRLFKYAENFT